jgi:hypothetical protein
MSALYGYACGDYNCECTTCHKIFSGDKRAITCLECAGQEAFNAGMERAAAPIDVLRQTLLEVAHAQQSGAEWYTKGHNGLYQQIALWVRKGDDAIKDFDAIRKEISND